MKPETLRLGDVHLEGASRAGTESWFRVHPSGVAFDVGRGALQLAGSRELFVTHGHLDHVLGVPYVLSQRTLHQMQGTRVFCPAETRGALADFIAAAARLEEAEYRFELTGLAPGDTVELGRDLAVEAFRTDHVVPSLGYHLVRRRRRLRADFRDLTGPEIAHRRAAGEDLLESVEELALTYCGDTGPGVFELEPRVFTTRALVIECTFLGDDLREKGTRYKHLHVEDLAAHADRFDNQHLVLVHLSRRHRPSELLAAAEARMPRLAGRIHVLTGEGQ